MNNLLLFSSIIYIAIICIAYLIDNTNSHHIPVIYGEELIQTIDKADTEVLKVETCKYLINMLDNYDYVCFLKTDIFNSTHGKSKNVMVDSIIKIIDLDITLDKKKDEFFKKMFESSDLFAFTTKEPITIMFTDIFEFYYDKVKDLLNNYTTYNNYTYTGTINIDSKKINYSTFPNIESIKYNNYCQYINNKENYVCISTNKNVYIDIIDSYINHLEKWLY